VVRLNKNSGTSVVKKPKFSVARHTGYLRHCQIKQCTWSDNTVRELIAVKMLHTSLLNITVVTFNVLPLGTYAPMLTSGPFFKTILELDLWNVLLSCCRVIPDVINVIKSLLSIFPLSSQIEKSRWGLDLVNREGVPAQLFVY
jgi:hypothetical protein